MTESATVEITEREGRPWPRPPRSVVAVAVVLLLAALAAYWVVDGKRQEQERLALTRCVEDARGAVERAERGLSTYYRYITPIVDPLRVDDAEGIYVLLSRDARESRPLVQRAVDRCEGVEVWWLHRDLRMARSAHLTLLYAELDRLDRVIETGMAYLGGGERIRELSDEADQTWR